MNSYEYCNLHQPTNIYRMSSYESYLLHGIEGDYAFLSYIADNRTVSCHKLRIHYKNKLPYVQFNVPLHKMLYLDEMLELEEG